MVLSTGLAQAQYSPSVTSDLGVGFGQAALSSSILQGTCALSGSSGQETRYKPDPRLAVKFSEARLAQFRQATADQLLKGKTAQQKREWIAVLVDNDMVNRLWVFNDFEKHSPGLSELVATYLGGMWKRVSGTRPNPTKLFGLREQLQRSMLEPARYSRIKAMSPAQRLG
ncbi:hypothetical protein GCM10008955_41950 [Deinococcus malanensis]|uniref:Uncharacterized protein n=1 Tax=Deinococcus malanensis TaxID=1706855 RepID=A0ABQ2F2V5_9DEIO|nr:hypothetical protein GCM10008955_41950 [Deinococcus malanensis]